MEFSEGELSYSIFEGPSISVEGKPFLNVTENTHYPPFTRGGSQETRSDLGMSQDIRVTLVY